MASVCATPGMVTCGAPGGHVWPTMRQRDCIETPFPSRPIAQGFSLGKAIGFHSMSL